MMNDEVKAEDRIGHSGVGRTDEQVFLSAPVFCLLFPSSSFIVHRSSFAFLSPSLSALLILGACFIVVCAVVAAMSRHQKSAGRPLRVEGRTGLVLEALEPEGAVLVDGELWRARVRGVESIAAGVRVRVVGARGHWLEVETDT